MKKFCSFHYNELAKPLVAVAIHSGHELRSEAENITALSDEERGREEDPYTDEFVRASQNSIVVNRSRFEVDLNRKRKNAVYRKPEDAWGLELWKEEPNYKFIRDSLSLYDEFYHQLKNYLSQVHKIHGYSVIYELHSFNYKRKSQQNCKTFPDIIIGTGKIDRDRWLPAITKLIEILQEYNFMGRKLKVTENNFFPGGNFPAHVAKEFPLKCCPLAIEFKKFFMDEKTGRPFPKKIFEIQKLIHYTINPVLSELQEIIE